jgi:type I restriction enzyme M protein
MREEVAKNGFNISPSRYIHTGAGEGFRPLTEIAQELRELDDEAKMASENLNKTLSILGI